MSCDSSTRNGVDSSRHAELFESVRPAIVNTLSRFTGNQPEAEQLAQDVFLKFHVAQLDARLPNLEAKRKYISRMASNAGVTYYRKNQSRRAEGFEILSLDRSVFDGRLALERRAVDLQPNPEETLLQCEADRTLPQRERLANQYASQILFELEDGPGGKLVSELHALARERGLDSAVVVLRFVRCFAFHHWPKASGEKRSEVAELIRNRTGLSISAFNTNNCRLRKRFDKVVQHVLDLELSQPRRAVAIRLSGDAPANWNRADSTDHLGRGTHRPLYPPLCVHVNAQSRGETGRPRSSRGPPFVAGTTYVFFLRAVGRNL
jgi:DNA-directed RNA polymerase specialized sigma24 family protein